MDNYLKGIVKEIKEHKNRPQETINRFQEHDVYDLESFLCIDKNSHDLEGQIDSLKDQIELILDGTISKDTLIENYEDWVRERIEQE